MNARTIDQVIVYSEPSAASTAMFELAAGDGVTVENSKHPAWVSIIAEDGRIGYIARRTRLFPVGEVALRQNQADVKEQPGENAVVKFVLQQGDTFVMTNVVQNDEGQWVEIQYIGDQVGYIPGATKIKGIVSKETAQKNIFVGGLICLVGIVITSVSYSSVVQTGGSYVIAWGAILYGGIRFFRGLFQLN